MNRAGVSVVTRRDRVVFCLGLVTPVVVLVAAELLTPFWCERWLRRAGI